MGLLAKFLHKAFYNPYKAIALCSNVVVGDATQLTKSFHVRFDVPRSDVALRIGSRCFLQNYFIFESDRGKITVGDGTFINGDTMVISHASIDIGRSVTIAWGCVIYDHDSHSISYLDRIADLDQTLIDYPLGSMVANKNWKHVNSAPIRICDHAWLGFDVVILKGVTIGEGAIVGARSVVTKDVPPWTIVAGNPARVVRELPLEYRRA